ncbi:MAG: hypothetical protein KI790_02130, partial [Cyclobacteriaceae bacterium]|nr:hypothetical protein [Cyclobacteriaceae bacterium HetDA_MAG_MS6]
NNFTIFKNKHVITIGTHNEFFKVRNSFVNRYNGHYEYDGLQNFLNDSTIGSNGRFRVAYSLDYFNDRFQAVELSFLQSALYVQDEWEAAPGLKLTIGLRADMPFFLDEPNYNQSFDNAFGLDTRDLPSGNILWSPRVGFNYDVKGDQSLQLRGGAGIFTGRIPFVWVANNYTNSGASLGLLSIRGSSGSVPLAPDGNRTLEYYFANQLNVDVDDPAVTSAIQTLISGDAGASEINVMDEDFKFPQVFRANLAVDTKLPSGFYGTFEALFSKAVNEIQYQNINLTDPDGNLAFEDNRPTHSSDLENGNFDNVLLITNTQKGYQFSLTGQVQKNWNNNLNSSFAYTYGVSRDVNGGTHTTALSGWEFNPTPGFSNNANVSWSVWDLRHRLMGNINYTHEWLDFTSTSIGLFYSGQSGAPFSYMVNGDLNGDGAFGNDQVYIPRDASEIILESSGSSDTRTEAQIWEELDAFIERDDYLSENRGKIAERNGARTPWTHLFDLRLMQEFKTNFGNKPNRIQLTLDIENVGNFLNKDWGRFNDVRFDSYNLLRFRRVDAATGKAVYQYSDQENAWTVDNDQSIWRMQFGVRYIFN